MTDLEITRLCAEAMGYQDVHIATASMGTQYVKHTSRSISANTEFRPLHDDAQCMALVKKFDLNIDAHAADGNSYVASTYKHEFWAENDDLNRAICECVAKMQKEAKP